MDPALLTIGKEDLDRVIAEALSGTKKANDANHKHRHIQHKQLQ